MDGRRTRVAWWTCWVVALAACSSAANEEPSSRATASTAPLIGSELSMDRADHDCQLVLRSVMRYPGGADYEQDCSGSECLYVWRGWIEVADTVDPQHSVHVLYHLTHDATWWEVEATEQDDAAPGYRRYGFALSEKLFGPAAGSAEGLAIELVAFLRDPGGARIFDHNRYRADFDNTQLTFENGFAAGDGGVCQPVVGTLWFHDNWDEGAHGIRRQGGYLEVHYDLDRLPHCRDTHNGYPAWDTVAYAKFFPGEQLVSGSVREVVTDDGVPTGEILEAPLVMPIPEDATAVELWFRNSSGAGSSCETWDSNYDANYRFDVWPPADHPRCQDVEKESGIRTEDYRMAHNQPHCVAYDVAAQYDASHCEFFVEGFGDGYVGHYGIPFHWLLAYLRIGAVEGEVLNAGMWSRFHDAETGEAGQRFLLGLAEAEGSWRTGFAYFTVGMMGAEGTDYIVDELAFFIDVRRPAGEVVRLWQSRRGANYGLSDAFALPTTREYIPYGNIEWSHPDSPIFDSRHGCD